MVIRLFQKSPEKAGAQEKAGGYVGRAEEAPADIDSLLAEGEAAVNVEAPAAEEEAEPEEKKAKEPKAKAKEPKTKAKEPKVGNAERKSKAERAEGKRKKKGIARRRLRHTN
jgi:hypothetical protein